MNSFSYSPPVSQSRQEGSGPTGVAGSGPSTGHLPSSLEVQRPGPRLSTHLILSGPSLGAPGNIWALSLPSRRLCGAGSSALSRLGPHCQVSPPAFATLRHRRIKWEDVLSERSMAIRLDVLSLPLFTLISQAFLPSLDFPGISTPGEGGWVRSPTFGFPLLSFWKVFPEPMGLKQHS